MHDPTMIGPMIHWETRLLLAALSGTTHLALAADDLVSLRRLFIQSHLRFLFLNARLGLLTLTHDLILVPLPLPILRELLTLAITLAGHNLACLPTLLHRLTALTGFLLAILAPVHHLRILNGELHNQPLLLILQCLLLGSLVAVGGFPSAVRLCNQSSVR